jgi:ubiquinone/menaquinone biosynthesis C-methylase UbiE
MSIEQEVAAHYGRPGFLDAILAALASTGKATDRIDPVDLAGVDEFHLGWRPATVAFAEDLAFPSGAHILDIGSGIGGPARYFAVVHRLRVTGIDLTPDFVATAIGLSERTGLADRVSFEEGSALALPFADASFDGATLIHVGMNIADKATLFAETRRVLKPGARFGLYEAMRGDGAFGYPLPWADGEATSFVETPATYRRLLEAAGFAVEREVDRSAMVAEIGRQMREHAARGGPPPVGLQILLGPSMSARIANVMQAVESGAIRPTEIIAHAA